MTRLVPTEKSLAEEESVDAVWSGTIRAALGRLDEEQVAAIEAASGALQVLDRLLHEDWPAPRSVR